MVDVFALSKEDLLELVEKGIAEIESRVTRGEITESDLEFYSLTQESKDGDDYE